MKCFRTNRCRKWRKTFNIEKFVVLAEYFEQQTNCNRYRRKIGQSRRSPSVEESVVFTLPYQTNGNHATEPSTVGHVILRTALERYFRFHWNCKQLCVQVRNSMPNFGFISQFSLKLYIQIWKYFHRMVLGSVGRG